MRSISAIQFDDVSQKKWILVFALLASVMLLAGCGSTKVYNAQKTLVYRGTIYNVTNVMQFSSRVEAVISETETIDLQGYNKKAIQSLLKQHKEVFVRQSLNLDEQEVIYQAQNVDSWSDYNKMAKKFASAVKDLQKFLGDPKKTQLEL